MRNIYTGIDIGSDSTKVLVLEKHNDRYNVLAACTTPTQGIKKGRITSKDQARQTVKQAIEEINSRLGTTINKAVISIPAFDVNFDIISSRKKITSTEKIVTSDDVFTCMKTSLKNKVEKNREVITLSPIEYKIITKKEQKLVSNPIGTSCDEIAVRSVLATTTKENVSSYTSLVEDAGIEVVDVIFGTVGDYFAIKNKDVDSKVAAIINIGGDLTNISIFNKGVMIKQTILEMGSRNVDNDISFIYKTNKNVARDIKEEFAVASRRYADSADTYECQNKYDQYIKLNQYEVAQVVEARIIDILKKVKISINNLTNREIGYIIITGGLTDMLGFQACVEDIFIKNTTVLNMGVIGARSRKYSSCYGIIKYLVDKLETRDKEYTMLNTRQIEEFLSTNPKVDNSSILNKIFGRLNKER